MQSVEVGIQRGTGRHLDAAGRGANAAASVAVDACLVSTAAAILVVVAAAARRMRGEERSSVCWICLTQAGSV